MDHMVADLCHFVFSCTRPERRMAKTRKHVFLSLLWPSRIEAKTRRHDKQRATTRKISTRRHEIFSKEIFVPSPVKMSLFRLAYFVFSCLRPESRNNDKKTWFHVFAFRGENTKWHKSATIGSCCLTVSRF